MTVKECIDVLVDCMNCGHENVDVVVETRVVRMAALSVYYEAETGDVIISGVING